MTNTPNVSLNQMCPVSGPKVVLEKCDKINPADILEGLKGFITDFNLDSLDTLKTQNVDVSTKKVAGKGSVLVYKNTDSNITAHKDQVIYLQHGANHSLLHVHKLAVALAKKGFTVVSIPLAGHYGAKPIPVAEYEKMGINALAKFEEDFIKELQKDPNFSGKKSVLAGHSMGGLTTAVVANKMNLDLILLSPAFTRVAVTPGFTKIALANTGGIFFSPLTILSGKDGDKGFFGDDFTNTQKQSWKKTFSPEPSKAIRECISGAVHLMTPVFGVNVLLERGRKVLILAPENDYLFKDETVEISGASHNGSIYTEAEFSAGEIDKMFK